MNATVLVRNVLVVVVGSSVFLAACRGGGASDSNSDDPFADFDVPSKTNTQPADSAPPSQPGKPSPAPTKTAEQLKPPVDFALHGLNADRSVVNFSITSQKAITRFVVVTRYLDAKGALVKHVQNGTSSSSSPLVRANTPTELEVEAEDNPAIASVEGYVAELVFADGTSWKLSKP